MRTGGLVLALTVSGAIGGVLGALLVQASAPSPGPVERAAAPAEPDRGAERRAKEAADMRNRVEVLEANLGNAVAETARLRETLAAETKASGEARDRLASLEKDAAPGEAGWTEARSGRKFDLGNGLRAEAAHVLVSGLGERFRKMNDLRALPLEDRWAKAREDLGLTTTQEEELKSAIKERDDGMLEVVRAALKEAQPADGAGAQLTKERFLDLEKTQENRRRYNDRVNQTLNVDQQKKWREEGYEGALGGGHGAQVTTVIRNDDGK